MNTLILYVFHKFNNRVRYFIEHGIFESQNYTFLIIINGDDDLNLYINVPGYVKLLKRDNIGFDFGGWSDGLLNNDLYKDYDNFIFVNSSCIGPFTPSYYSGNWCDIFIKNITDDVKLFGTTINNADMSGEIDVLYKAHVQSWAFCMDKVALKLLINKGIFSKIYEKNLVDTVNHREIGMSREIIRNGWNIGSLMIYYDNIDFRFKDKQPSEYNITFLRNCGVNNGYFDSNLHPYEVIFVKANRNVNQEWLDIYLKKQVLERKISKAIYGNDSKYINVTNIINSFVGKTFKISNQIFGDPAYEIVKNLIILDHDDNVLINIEEDFYNNNIIKGHETKTKYIDILSTC